MDSEAEMERSKAAGSVEVRRVIGALCRLLAGLGVDPVPAPDAFRRAKFGGGPEVGTTRFCLWFRSVRLVPANNTGTCLLQRREDSKI